MVQESPAVARLRRCGFAAFSKDRMKRIAKELPACRARGFDVSLPEEENILCWHVKLTGPADSPYEGGSFVLDVTFPPQYPFKAPDIKFLTKIYHPNVDPSSFEICADSFSLGATWGPTQNMTNILALFGDALKDPTPGDTPLNTEAAAQFVEDRTAFDSTAQAWTAEHAKAEA